jgi:ATP-dependent Lon protease
MVCTRSQQSKSNQNLVLVVRNRNHSSKKKVSTSKRDPRNPNSGNNNTNNDICIERIRNEEEEEDVEEIKSSSSNVSSSSPDDDETLEEEDEEEGEEEEDEYDLPLSIRQDEKLNAKALSIIEHIHKKTPQLSNILSIPMRKKHRTELFELYFLYQETLPFTEERLQLKEVISQLTKQYSKQYTLFKEHKKDVLEFEKKYEHRKGNHKIPFDIIHLPTSLENKEIIFNKYCEMNEKDSQDEEYYKLKTWIHWALQLPFDKIQQFPFPNTIIDTTLFLKNVRETLDRELYGMQSVKDQLLLFLHHKIRYPHMRGSCLGLIGDCGVGKTTIARTLAKVMTFPFEQISFGGVNQPEYLRGFDYTYVGSQPGEIVKCLCRMKCKNGVLFLDEYEKISEKPEIVSFLLHLTDFSQNNEFKDAYLSELKIDLSHMWFIYSMNQLPTDRALTDRIFTIQVPSYSLKEKLGILSDYILPKLLKNYNLSKEHILLQEEVGRYLIEKVHHESSIKNSGGVRQLEQAIRTILYKIDFSIQHKDSISMQFTKSLLHLSTMEYPITITREMVDVLLNDWKKDSSSFLSMYA